jgi:predicted peroxiredoxin
MTKFDTALEIFCQMQDKALADKHEKEKQALRLKQFKMAQTISDLISQCPELEKEFLKCFKA